MSRTIRWSFRLLAFMAIVIILLVSGIFDPLAESMKYIVTGLMNYIPTEKFEPYPDRVESNYFLIYIMFNMLAAAAVTFIGEKIIWLVRNT